MSVKIQILKIFVNKTCLKVVVETLMIEHFEGHKPSPILGHQWKYNGWQNIELKFLQMPRCTKEYELKTLFGAHSQ